MAKELLLEAWCRQCAAYYYSLVFNEECAHYCPECGAEMEITGRKFGLLPHSDWQKWRRRCSYENQRNAAVSRSREQ